MTAAFIHDRSRARQVQTMLASLKNGPVSTVQAREELGISHPAGRVLDLRAAGHKVITYITREIDAQGFNHRSALYVLEVKS